MGASRYTVLWMILVLAKASTCFQAPSSLSGSFFRPIPVSWQRLYNNKNIDIESEPSSSSVFVFAASLDPASREAQQLVTDNNCLGLSTEQWALGSELAQALVDWNDKVNLVSRRDCSVSTVFGRHVLPCWCTANKNKNNDNDTEDSFLLSSLFASTSTTATTTVMDVGCGGGFPGLPLAIQYPTTSFVLADSVGKKVRACASMAGALGLHNVETYHGRVEDYFVYKNNNKNNDVDGNQQQQQTTAAKFDVITGRSVTALPQFCAYVADLLKDDGHLVYWTGGEIEDATVSSRVAHTLPIADVIPSFWKDDGDKKIVVFTAAMVREIAAESGIVVVTTSNAKQPSVFQTKRKQAKAKKQQRPKGSWRRNEDRPRQRGHENFQRFSSIPAHAASNDNNDDASSSE